jgi:adenylylsulfate kinase-like enzyme
VYLAGAPECGKSTLACAWGRDLAAQGHGVLLLDRDREDENASKDIRALFNRCRAVVDAGGNVALLHHPGLPGMSGLFADGIQQ